MDLSVFDVLPPSPLFDDRVDDVLSANAPFMLDPFTAPSALSDECNLPPPRTQLLLDPFDSPPIPLLAAAPPLSPPPCLSAFVRATDTPLSVAPIIAPPSPELQQENVPANTRPVHHNVCGPVVNRRPNVSSSATTFAAVGGTNTSAEANRTNPGGGGVSAAAVAAAVSAEQRSKDKLAQRKLRNKESARRYREKQVARRRQLETYTRTLSEQNRELEILHHKLLTLTCQRSMRAGTPLSDVAPRVL